MSLNWVMLDQDNEPVLLPGESFVLKLNGRYSFSMKPPDRQPVGEGFPPSSKGGKLYLSRQRVVYIPAEPTESFKHFSAPINNFGDCKYDAAYIIGPWRLKAQVLPVSGGNLPSCPFVQIEIVFNDEGSEAWRTTFSKIREDARHEEPLPRYSQGAEQAAPRASNQSPTGPPQPGPDESPPGYEESQIQSR